MVYTGLLDDVHCLYHYNIPIEARYVSMVLIHEFSNPIFPPKKIK